MANNRKGLGRGLSTLLNGENYQDQINNIEEEKSGLDAFENDVVIRKAEEGHQAAKDVTGKSNQKIEAPTKKKNKKSLDITEVDIEAIMPNPNQPRTQFDDEELEQLSASIKRNGLLQPISVTEEGDGTYEIIAGERR